MTAVFGCGMLSVAYSAYTNPMSDAEKLALATRRDPTGRRQALKQKLALRRDAEIARLEVEKVEKAKKLKLLG